MPRKVVTPEDLAIKYGPCEGFVPDVLIEVMEPHTKKRRRFDYIRVEKDGDFSYGYTPNESDPLYALPPRGSWQCFECHGKVRVTEVSYRALHVKDVPGFVYFIQSGETGPFKIGWSQNVERRLAELQVANPSQLFLRGMVPGTMESEQEFHRRFQEAHVTGEWFQNSVELRDFVESLAVE